MENSSPTQLRFPASAGFTIRADFEGEAMTDRAGQPFAAQCPLNPTSGQGLHGYRFALLAVMNSSSCSTAADQALCRAKQAGRNNAQFADEV